MTDKAPAIKDDELHAYIDGQVDATRRAAVEAYLASNPDGAARITAYQQQNDALHALFDPVLREPVPAQLSVPVRQRPRWPRYAMAAVWALVWAAGGWFLHDVSQDPTQASVAELPRQALIAHAVYTPEVVHPVEVTAAQQAHLVKWLSKRLGGKVKTPDLRALGYELIGGRLLPASNGAPAAQFMYQTEQGKRLTLYVRRNVSENHDTAFRYAANGDVSVFYWIDHDFGYALSGEVGKKKLLDLAHAVYNQL